MYYNWIFAYAQSKVFQIMHSYKLQRHFHVQHKHVTAVAVHPGMVATDFNSENIGDVEKMSSLAKKLTLVSG